MGQVKGSATPELWSQLILLCSPSQRLVGFLWLCWDHHFWLNAYWTSRSYSFSRVERTANLRVRIQLQVREMESNWVKLKTKERAGFINEKFKDTVFRDLNDVSESLYIFLFSPASICCRLSLCVDFIFSVGGKLSTHGRKDNFLETPGLYYFSSAK